MGTHSFITIFKKLLSYLFIEFINLAHWPKSGQKELPYNRGY